MTYEEFGRLPLRMTGHVSMGDEHISTEICHLPKYGSRIIRCFRIPYVNGEPKGRVKSYWIIDGKIVKTKKEIIEAIKEL